MDVAFKNKFILKAIKSRVVFIYARVNFIGMIVF